MKKLVPVLFFSFFIVFTIAQNKQKLTIAVAANMQFAAKEIVSNFTKETGINCNLIIGSSGKLTAQISQGAPFDVFISADMKYPNNLYKNGFTLNKPQIYAYGKLILWSMSPTIKPSMDLLKTSAVKHIALANPKMAPYGEAAIATLNYYKLFPLVKNKLVYGESIAQTNQFIITQAAEIGLTSKSVVLSTEMKNKGNWIAVDEKSYEPIAQGVVLLKNSNHTINAQNFYNFLFSEKGKKILVNYGYSVNLPKK